MLKILIRHRFLLLLLLGAVFIRLFALNESWVERYYTFGLYPPISNGLRQAFGWIPFSVGDLLYLLAFVAVVLKVWKLVLMLRRQRTKEKLTWALFRKYLKLSLLVYIVFSLFWGLNYYRQGISSQLALKVEQYSVDDLFALTMVLQQRLNTQAEKVDSIHRLRYNNNKLLFKRGQEAYRLAQQTYPFLAYRHPSLKPSLYTSVGHWFGFTGYYNPFSAEAQLKTSVPVFLKPFVVTHEIAHQLGYAKENEASFVAYLTCKSSNELDLLYSAYFELYRDAIFECRMTPNKDITDRIRQNIHPRVKTDSRDLQLYLLRNQNLVEPFMTGVYDRYLKLNNQPKGKATYNEVIAYMVAYMKKFGKEAI